MAPRLSKEYELTHLVRNPKKNNMAATIIIRAETEAPKTHIRVLGIQIDTKLRWGPQIKKIQENTGDTDVCTYQSSNFNMGSVFRTSKACLLCGGTTRYYLWINCLALPLPKSRSKITRTTEIYHGRSTRRPKRSIGHPLSRRESANTRPALPPPFVQRKEYIDQSNNQRNFQHQKKPPLIAKTL